MYEDKKIKIPFRDIALQLIVIVLFVLALLWFFPAKKTMNDSDNNSKNNQSINNNNSNSKNNDSSYNKDSNNKENNSKDNDKDDNKKISKKYEYAKTSEVSYGEYGPWSDWSTNYVAASDTVDVQTEVRKSVNGWKSNYVQTGTKTEENVVVGTKTNNKVIAGYNVEFVSTIDGKTSPLSNFDDYLYVLTYAYKKYKCADGSKIKQEIHGAPITPDKVTYDYLKNQNGDLSSLNPPASCVNPEIDANPLTYDTGEQYNYSLYKRIPIYTTVTENIYGDVTSPVYEEQTENTYGNVTYYRFRTRSYKAGGESIKWSDSDNDETLISQGYHFTGNVK